MPPKLPTIAISRRVTSYDVALAAGVAQSTVSRAFRPESELAPATRARVQTIASNLGYVPNAIARSLITRRSDMVALIVTDFTLRANPAIIGGIGRALAQNGKQLLLLPVDADSPREAHHAAETAQRYPLDGLVVAALLPGEAVRPFLQRGVPVVFFNRPVNLPHVDRVATDHATAARDVATRLHQAGHRRILCMAGPPDWPVNRERVDGFRAGLAACGIHTTPILPSGPTYEAGREAFRTHAAATPPPDAVFCVNDPIAFGVLDACRFDLNLPVPQAISVIGFDDVDEAAHQSFSLTTIRQDLDALANAIVTMLLTRAETPAARGRRLLLPGILIRRNSAKI